MTIEAYKTNASLRDTYLRINGITHAEIWDTDDGYQVALCTDDSIGYPESPEFATVGQCHKWLAEYAPGLSCL